MRSHGRGLHDIEFAPVDELRDLQLRRLRWSLAHAYAHVPAYRTSFDGAGVHPDDLSSLDDLSLFPFTTKADLRDNYPFGMFAVPREQVLRIHASSGTTGKATVVGYTQSDLDMWTEVYMRSLVAAGVRPGDVVHVAFGYGLFTGGLGGHYGAERLGCTVVPASTGQTARQVQLLVDFDADVLLGTPSYALVLADEFARQGIDPASTSLRVGVFGAEPWSEAMRAEIEAAFGIDAVDMLIIKGVNVFPTQFEELVMLDSRLTPHFILEVRKDGHLDTLRVLIEPEADEADHPALAAEFAEAVRQRIGISVDVGLVGPGTIERSEGKAKRVRDLRGG